MQDTLLKLFIDKLECDNCERKLPNKDMKTKNGCVWCDNLYWK